MIDSPKDNSGLRYNFKKHIRKKVYLLIILIFVGISKVFPPNKSLQATQPRGPKHIADFHVYAILMRLLIYVRRRA